MIRFLKVRKALNTILNAENADWAKVTDALHSLHECPLTTQEIEMIVSRVINYISNGMRDASSSKKLSAVQSLAESAEQPLQIAIWRTAVERFGVDSKDRLSTMLSSINIDRYFNQCNELLETDWHGYFSELEIEEMSNAILKYWSVKDWDEFSYLEKALIAEFIKKYTSIDDLILLGDTLPNLHYEILLEVFKKEENILQAFPVLYSIIHGTHENFLGYNFNTTVTDTLEEMLYKEVYERTPWDTLTKTELLELAPYTFPRFKPICDAKRRMTFTCRVAECVVNTTHITRLEDISNYATFFPEGYARNTFLATVVQKCIANNANGTGFSQLAELVPDTKEGGTQTLNTLIRAVSNAPDAEQEISSITAHIIRLSYC